MNEDNKIAIIIGTKAELIKCMPVMLELQKRKISYWFIHTGQHPLGKACREFRIKEPDFILSEEPKITTKFWSKVNSNSISWCFKMIYKIRKLIKNLKPSYVIYHGDTMSTAVAAMASSKLLNLNKSWKNVHLEAGLRSNFLMEPFPEEISRRMCDWFSDILLSVSDYTTDLLEDKYGCSKEIIQVGNTIIDSSLITYELSKKKYSKIKEPYALINLHRHENLKDKKRLQKIVNIIKEIKIKAIWPLHDNTKKYLMEYDLMKQLNNMENLEITPLKDYSEFIFLLANCKYILADGGSIQEESLVFKKPFLILRRETERKEGIGTGLNYLTSLDLDLSKMFIEMIETDNITSIIFDNFENPYGKEGVSELIVDLLKGENEK